MKTNKRILIAAIFFGVITVFAANQYLRSLDKPAMDSIPQTTVVVAKTIIPAHTRILAEMLEVRTISTDGVHPDAMRNLNDVAGGITRTEIITGEQILGHRIITDERNAILAYRIPEGMRAISIPIGDASGVAGYISPGDNIDILISFDDKEINDMLTTYTIFQKVKVLATGGETRDRDNEDQGVVNTLTLAVLPEQAEVLAFANMTGNIYVTLRSPLDDAKLDLDSFSFELFETYKERGE